VHDLQVCGLAGCSAGWCSTPCSGSSEYAGFWCGGACDGSIAYALPAEYDRGVITVGMSYGGADCHGTVTVGDQSLMDNTGFGDLMKLEFQYKAGDVITVSEASTCIVYVYELKVVIRARRFPAAQFSPPVIQR
jgi:hypothetical protein